VDGSGNFTPTSAASANAVKVAIGSTTRNVFLTGSKGLNVSATAIQGNGHTCLPPNTCVVPDGSPLGTVRVGSTLASASTTDATLMNKLLNATVGGSYSMDVVGYQGIASGNVSFSRLRTALGLSAGTVSNVLSTSITFRQLLDATVNALNADGSPSSVTAATKLATIASQVAANAGVSFTLGSLFNVVGNVGGGTDVAGATINAMDILRGGMALADSSHFASVNLTALDLNNLVPGLTGVTVNFGLIQPPQQRSGPPGKAGGVYQTTATTSQIRLSVVENLTLNLPIGALGALVPTAVSVPYYLNVGNATASLDNMACPSGASTPTSVGIMASTTAGSTSIGSVSNGALSSTSTSPTPSAATLVNVAGVVTVSTTGAVNQTISGNPGTLKTFTPDYATAPSQNVAGVQTVSLPPLVGANLTVGLLGLGLNAGNIISAVVTGVANAVTPLTNALVQPLFRSLGLSFAGADVWAPPVQACNPVSYNVGGPSTPPNPPIPTLVG
jgi:uncharacterized membrane protein